MSFIRWVVVAAVALTLSGCVTIDRQGFNREGNGHIKSIAVLKAPRPAEYSVNIIHHPGVSFGLIGGLAAAIEISTKTSGLTEKINATGFDAAQVLTDAVMAELQKDSRFKLIAVDEDHHSGKTTFLEDYARLDNQADAVLDFVPKVMGYWAASHTTPYYPTLSVAVRLVDLHSKNVIYNSLFVYGPLNVVPKGSTQMMPSAQFAVASYDELIGQPDRSTNGLKSVAAEIASRIAADLR
jgi:hypothetical protein